MLLGLIICFIGLTISLVVPMFTHEKYVNVGKEKTGRKCVNITLIGTVIMFIGCFVMSVN